MRDTNLGDEPDQVTEFLDEYGVVSKFETEISRIHVQALGMKIHSLDYGRGSYEFDVLEEMEGQAAVYYPPDIDFSAVLLFQTGWGYFCCQSPRDVEQIQEWFQDELEEEAKGEDSLVDLPDVEFEY